MLSTLRHTVDEHERHKETINWSKGSLILKIAKVSISEYVSAQWEAFLLTWTTEELEDLPHFFDEVDADKIKYKNKKWKIETSCEICKKIFKNILQKQQNQWSRHLVWKPVEKQTKYSGSKIVETNDYQKYCEICRKKQCPFAAEQEGFDLQKTKPHHFGLVALFQGHTPNALNNISEFYWRIANMFMCFGRETNVTRNSSPADTDPSLVFKMMKNCKLFEPLEEELDIYDQLKAANIPTIDDVIFIQRAFEIQQDAVKYDLNVKGRYGVSEYVLQGVLEINEMKYKNQDWTYDADIKNKEDIASIDSLKAEISRLESRISVLIQEKEQLRQSLIQEKEQQRQSLIQEKEQLRQRLSQEIEQLKQRIRDLEKQNHDISKKNLVREVVAEPVVNASGKGDATTTYLCGTGGMTTGAAVGAIAGPPGMIIGAAVGGLLGGIFGAKK